ncbi:MAG TPA: hypothetical protein VGK36_00100 [Candidatus Angelobacter sp.]|jgi:hypothetical protein
MAIARCEQHGKPRNNVKPPGYSNVAHLPVGHPNSGVICGKKECENPAQVWLKEDEEAEYKQGQRIFEIHTRTAKVKVQ